MARRKKPPGGGKFHRPTPERQSERLSPQFERLQRALEERRARLQMEARDLVPEEVVVLETTGTVDKIRLCHGVTERSPAWEAVGKWTDSGASRHAEV